MINENKVKLMTRLAMHEQKEGKDALRQHKYYKSDYISIRMIDTVITITLSYILAVILWGITKNDYILNQLVRLDIKPLAIRLISIYLIILIIYIFISYVVYSLRYIKIMEMNRKYADLLKELYIEYKKEQAEQKEADMGGFESDEQNT